MNKEENRTIRYISMFWTIWGLFTIFYFYDITNGLLMMILGELIYLKKL